MKRLLIVLTVMLSGCAAGQQKADRHQQVAWVPCEVEVVTYQDTSKTIEKVIKTYWYCENSK